MAKKKDGASKSKPKRGTPGRGQKRQPQAAKRDTPRPKRKKDAPKKDAPKKDAPKKDAPKKDAPKKDAPKKDEPKKDEPTGGGRKAPPPGCTYRECVVQEVSITSLARQQRVKKFFYVHTRTNVAPIGANGVVNDAASVNIDPRNPGVVNPNVANLVAQAEAALGQSLEDLLDVHPRRGRGRSVHAFGCADECTCKKKKYRLPDGREVEAPAHTASDPIPPGRNAVPGLQQPLATIERRVQIPGRGLHLLTYEIRFYGSVSRYRGECS